MMKRFYTLLFFYCCSFSVFSQENDTIRRWFGAENLNLVKKSQAVFTGLQIRSDDHWQLVIVYPDTNLLLLAYFKDKNLKIKDGPFHLYHKKGKKALQGTYVDNVKQGVWQYWDESGQLIDSGRIKNNQMTGEWLSYHPNGKLMNDGYYTEDSAITEKAIPPDIPHTYLLDDSDLKRERNGPWLTYAENGQLIEKGFYKNEKKEGLWENWYPTGQLESSGKFANNLQDGEWCFYRENGQLSSKEIYKASKVVSMECFNEQGLLEGNFCSIKKPAIPALDRFTDFKTYMLDHIFWPKELDGHSVNGIVKVSFTVTKEGKLSAIKILEEPHELLGKEVIRFFNSIEKWYPAVSHNRNIDYTSTIEIPFLR